MENTLRRWLTPGFADLIFVALISWLFILSPKGWGLLLSDGDTGWHIRTGEWILANHRVPYTDLFSFSRPGEPWYAWEWGADVLFALLHGWGGLALLSFFCGFVLISTSVITLRWMIWRGASVIAAFPILLLSIGGSTMHYLARPHVFTLLFLAVELWLLDAERRAPSRRIWLLVPLTLLWTNLHGGWPALFVFLGIQIAARLVYRDPRWRTEALVGLACAAVTLVNPYGYQLHLHIAGYLQSSWIRDSVDEFQSPRFRSENILQYEALLLVGIGAAWGRAFRGMAGLTEAVMVWLWAHLSLGAVRHAPIYILAAAPVAATELSLLLESAWANARKSSVAGIFRALDLDLRPKFASNSVWALALGLMVCLLSPDKLPHDFPAALFPVEAASRIAPLLATSRTFTSDQWGDYLLYKHWPQTRVFIDGRSDFFGPQLGAEYLDMINATALWRKRLDEHAIDLVLVPASSELRHRLASDAQWQLIHSDRLSVAFRRLAAARAAPTAAHLFSPAGLMKDPITSEGIKENRQ
jgi:hypothetical protein